MKIYKEIIKKCKGCLIGGFVLKVLSSFILVFAGYSLSFLLSAYEDTTENQQMMMIRNAGIVLIIWIIALLFLYSSSIVEEKVLCRMRNYLREKMAKKIAYMQYEEFYEKDSGHYVSWLTNDVEQISEQAFEPLFSFAGNLATAIFSLSAMLFLGIYIGIVAVIMFIGISVLPQLMSKQLEKAGVERSTEQEVGVEAYKDTIMGYQVYKINNLMNLLQQRIKIISKKVEAVNYKYSKCGYRVNTVVSGIGLLGQVVLLVVTLMMAIYSTTPIGAVLSVGNLAQSFFGSVGAVVQGVIAIKAAKTLFIKYESEEVESENRKVVDIKTIEFKEVGFAYEDKRILDKVELSFEMGKKYAIIGESGSGKTTLMKILMGFLPEYSGKVMYNETELKDISLENLYQQIAYLEQNVYLFQGSIRFNITLGKEYTEEQIWNVLKKCKLDQYVKTLPEGLETIVEENGKNLSGGQRQRIALVRTLLRDVHFIILDEGTSALDELNAQDIENSLMEEPDIGVIIITHYLRDSVKEKLQAVYQI